MVIQRDNRDLPKGRAPLPSTQQLIARPMAEQWWKEFQAGPDFRRARAIPELPLRASAVSLRCDRQFWYSLVDAEPTDAADAAGVFRMRLGSLVHAELAGLEGKIEGGLKQGWFPEEAIDLRPAGFEGSAHGDWIRYEDGKPTEVAEIKTVGGYAFKLMASNFNGDPQGPKWEHWMQAAMVAKAVGADKIRVVYFSMENLAPDVANAVGADEYGRFCAEWVDTMDNWEDVVYKESRRQARLLNFAQPEEGQPQIMPERTLWHPDYPGGAVVVDPKPGRGKAKWVKYNASGEVTMSGTTWICDYCDWRERCLSDGGEMHEVAVTIGKPS